MNKTTLKLLIITCFFSTKHSICMDCEKRDTLPVLRKNISINENEAWLMEEKIEFSLPEEKVENPVKNLTALTISPFTKNEEKDADDSPLTPNISPVKKSTHTRNLPEVSHEKPLKASLYIYSKTSPNNSNWKATPTDDNWRSPKASLNSSNWRAAPTDDNWRSPKASPNSSNWKAAPTDDNWRSPKASPNSSNWKAAPTNDNWRSPKASPSENWKNYSWSPQKSPPNIYYSPKKPSAKSTPKIKKYRKYIFIGSEKYNKFPAEEAKISYADGFFGCLAKVFKTCSNSASEISDIANKIKELMYKNPTFVYFSDTKDKNEACRREISQRNSILPTKYNCSDAYFFYYCEDPDLSLETKMNAFFASLIKNIEFCKPTIYVSQKKADNAITSVVSYINCPITYPSICFREINGRNSAQWFFAHEACVMLEGDALPQSTKIFPTLWDPETNESLTILDLH